ncbi:MAG: hypothetical protein GF329_02880 [Candidatus Lokiarchaeota archaeon]|nr:hypothetical protein [Candidatus Lokiarchaeota archaeon]
MINADSFANAILMDNTEKINEWVNKYNDIVFSRPFFRTTTGKNTYFVIDSEIIDAGLSRTEYLEIMVDFWRGWKDNNPDYNFFWKLSGIGIHALQRINGEVNPLRFKNVLERLFPKKSGWKRYNGYLINNYKKNNKNYRVAIDLSMCDYPKLIRWVFSPYWKIKNKEYFSIPINQWDIDHLLKHSLAENIKIEKYSIPKFQFENFLGSDVISSYPGFRNRYWKTGYDLNIPMIGEKTSNGILNKIQNIINSAPLCIRKSNKYIKNNDKDHYKRIILLKYLQKSGFSLEEIAIYFRFKLNAERKNKEPWKVCYYCNFYYNKELKLDKIDQASLCNIFTDIDSKYYVLSKKNCIENNCKYLVDKKSVK